MDDGNSAPTINKYIRSLRAFFNFLCSNGYLTENPIESVDKLAEEKRVLRTLSRDQVTALLDEPNRSTPAGYRNYVFLLLILNTGIRLEEALSFGVEDIYWQERVIKVFGKGSKERYIHAEKLVDRFAVIKQRSRFVFKRLPFVICNGNST
ncbi:tyrosine-type recombinase/integrase [Paenibacillus sp. NPDC101420]|uniref:tyrosine-type recombinase/integrase n=1 Tax=Paenibacillus sp. NPDC101420 TaxID=3390602 RepID=UPI003CFD4365